MIKKNIITYTDGTKISVGDEYFAKSIFDSYVNKKLGIPEKIVEGSEEAIRDPPKIFDSVYRKPKVVKFVKSKDNAYQRKKKTKKIKKPGKTPKEKDQKKYDSAIAYLAKKYNKNISREGLIKLMGDDVSREDIDAGVVLGYFDILTKNELGFNKYRHYKKYENIINGTRGIPSAFIRDSRNITLEKSLKKAYREKNHLKE